MTADAADRFARGRDWERDVLGYPDPAVEIVDGRFRKGYIPAASVERLWTGARWAEGPVWFADHRALLFSDIPNDRILRWCEQTGVTTVFRAPSDFANGNARDNQGRLLCCQQGGRCVTRIEYDGRATVLIDRFEGKRLNAPNDLVCHADGSIWFTDPGYGILGYYEGDAAEAELPTRVYRLDPLSGVATVATDELARPNGLCFSPDYRRLYIVDTGCTDDPSFSRCIRTFDVDGSRLGNGRDFCDMNPARSDGIRCDRAGNLWAASGFGGADHDGIQVFAPDGGKLAHIHLPEPCSNLCFGGRRGNRLFMTAGKSLYGLYVDFTG